MQPDAHQPQSADPAQLPQVSSLQPNAATQGGPALAAAPSMPPTAPQASMADAANQAKRLVAQYQQDPYRLSEAIGQLKASAQAVHYNITPNSSGN
jgi:hypothetical protein